ncbi:mucin-4-like [Protopterus annectens]|uniref:mucin-4-like n=1 Tax=Protopterus annectens TaxID=7888 RepID=UPI001CFB3E31|nr:mucin-4-like [Protopterus annectens]
MVDLTLAPELTKDEIGLKNFTKANCTLLGEDINAFKALPQAESAVLFSGSGTSCVDINECNIQGVCQNGLCKNTDGSYVCTCNTGYTQKGTLCIDTDECATRQNNCSTDAICSNTPGSFTCSCNSGFSGNGVVCTPIACYNDVCPSGYCSNGGTCSINPTKNCMAECQCLKGFTGSRCTDFVQNFMPRPLPTIPRRKIKVTLKQTIANLTSESNWNVTLAAPINESITSIMEPLSMGTFEKNENIFISLLPLNDSYEANITSDFMYNANSTVIQFLNVNLLSKVISALQNSANANKRLKRTISSSNISYSNSSATDAEPMLSIEQLKSYFNCALETGYDVYDLEYNPDVGFQCVSRCAKGYCLNNATCLHQQTGPVCMCNPVSMYSPYGTHCENLAVNLNGFFGILFGALAFLLLLILGIILAVFCCRRRKSYSHDILDITESSPPFKSSPLSPSTNIQVTSLQKQSVPHLIHWAPVLENVDTSVKSVIQRPSLKSDKQNGGS